MTDDTNARHVARAAHSLLAWQRSPQQPRADLRTVFLTAWHMLNDPVEAMGKHGFTPADVLHELPLLLELLERHKYLDAALLLARGWRTAFDINPQNDLCTCTVQGGNVGISVPVWKPDGRSGTATNSQPSLAIVGALLDALSAPRQPVQKDPK